jgi:general secretion pathway protein G
LGESSPACKKFPEAHANLSVFFPTTFLSHGVFIPDRLKPDAKRFFMKNHHSSPTLLRSKGFTLLEMVIVLGIIAMILGGAIFAMKGISGNAMIAQAEADFKTIETTLMSYKLLAGNYPTTQQGLKALVEKPTSTPVPRRWSQTAKKVPLDPWKNEYGYRFPGKKNPAEPEIFTKGPDGMENTADDFSSQDE